jgi:hypothetical protein
MLNFYAKKTLMLLVRIALWTHPANSFRSAIESDEQDIVVVRRMVSSLSDKTIIDRLSLPGKIIVIPPQQVLSSKDLESLYDQTIKDIKRIPDYMGKEFIFSGYKEGGEIALNLASLWFKECQDPSSQKLQPHQVKAITFCTHSKDEAFNESISEQLCPINILNFSGYYSGCRTPGVSILLLPDESLANALSQTWKATGWKEAGLTLLTGFGLNLALGPSLKLATLALTGGTLLSPRVTGSYSADLPEESYIQAAFNYAQENYRTSEEASLSSIGRPPLLSTRRGIGEAFIRFLRY